MHILPFRTEFHGHRQTDRNTGRHMTKLIVAFRNSANALKIIMNGKESNDFYGSYFRIFTVVSRPFIAD
jgi:hypothetical protein